MLHAYSVYGYIYVMHQTTKSNSVIILFCICSPKGDLLIFLSAHEAVKTGVHNSTNSLHSIKWPIDKENEVNSSLKEVVSFPLLPSFIANNVLKDHERYNLWTHCWQVSVKQPKGGFPGLYCESLIGSPWLLDNETIVLSSLWFSSEAIIAINTRRFIICLNFFC